MSKTYTASILTRTAKPRSKDLLGTQAAVTKSGSQATGLTTTQLQLLKNLSDWFGYDEDSKSVFVKKDAQGLPRNFYTFGNLAAGGITAEGQGGSSDVQWIQLYPSSGQKIATITINGVATDVYAPVGGSGGTGNYNDLENRPKIAGTTLTGDLSLATLGIAAASHTHSQYLTTTSAASLYLSQNDAAQNYQAKITSTNKLAYTLLSGAPTALGAFTDDLGSSPAHTHSQYLRTSDQTWRAVNVGGESLLSGSNSTALNLVAGDNISLTRGTLGKVTIASTGLTQEQRTAIDNFIAWFGIDTNGAVYVKKDAQGNARNFYCFGEVTGGGITATGGGGGGTGDYDNLLHRPKIAGHTLTGNMSIASLGLAAANHTHSQYLTASALDGYLPKTGGTLTGRLTINDAASYKPLILNTTRADVASVRTEFQVRGTMVGQFEYGLDTEWLKLFISDGHGYGIAISGTNSGQSTYGRLLYIQNNAQREVYHSGNSNKNDVNWQGKDITAAGKFVGNKWYPSANDTAHYIEFVDGHWYIHGDVVCSGEITGGQITVNTTTS